MPPYILCFSLFCTFVFSNVFAYEKGKGYLIQINLNEVINDKIRVTLFPPAIHQKSATYIMPTVIPGSYSKKDYGRFIENFKAFSLSGNELKVTRKGFNYFEIENANDLNKIEYYINDTWDNPRGDSYIFQPGGTNIDAGRNYFINNFGFFGYFDGYSKSPYQLEVNKPGYMYGSTELNVVSRESFLEVFSASDYRQFADNPILYCTPDTAGFRHGQTKIFISVFSASGIVKADSLVPLFKNICQGLENFFSALPVDRYSFIFFFTDSRQKDILGNGGFGALEHNYCSFYFLPEMNNTKYLHDLIQSTAVHEFLHIITPLNLHSHEIADFDFASPRMSKHLWLYEGVVEYFAVLMQLQQGLTTRQAFIKELREKINIDEQHKPMSLVKMSKKVLKKKFNIHYDNVYYKGALNAFMIDILLNETTEGKFNLRDLILNLSSRYGKNKPFSDDDFLNEIYGLTSEKVKDYFQNHVVGKKPLPVSEYFAKIGWKIIPPDYDTITTCGVFDLELNTTVYQLRFTNTGSNIFNIKDNDILVSVNKLHTAEENFEEIDRLLFNPSPFEKITCEIIRNKEMILTEGTAIAKIIERKNRIIENPDAGEKEKWLREKVLGVKEQSFNK